MRKRPFDRSSSLDDQECRLRSLLKECASHINTEYDVDVSCNNKSGMSAGCSDASSPANGLKPSDHDRDNDHDCEPMIMTVSMTMTMTMKKTITITMTMNSIYVNPMCEPS